VLAAQCVRDQSSGHHQRTRSSIATPPQCADGDPQYQQFVARESGSGTRQAMESLFAEHQILSRIISARFGVVQRNPISAGSAGSQ
jgi:hypothetical protein